VQDRPTTSRQSFDRLHNEMSSPSSSASFLTASLNPLSVILRQFTNPKHRSLLALI
jgi:hypothetical protein